jgi:hypothetical protein
MREEIYKISFKRYNTIKFKDHSNIDGDNIFGEMFKSNEPSTKKPHLIFSMESSNTTEECFVKNFANQLYSVSVEYVMVVVEKDGDKVSIKMFQGYKYRREGKPWFKISKNVDYISVNTKTGDVYNGYLRNYQNKYKCSKMIRRNTFYFQPLNSLKSQIKNALSKYSENSFNETTQAFTEFMFNVDQKVNFENLTFSDRLFRFYLNKRGIKYPNNFNVYTKVLLGPEIKKLIKKKNNRLVDGVMEKYGFSGKKLKKALHECTNLNINLYQSAKKLFGDDWINQDGNIILDLLNSSNEFSFPNQFLELVKIEELRKVYSLFKETYIYNNLDTYTFIDHIRMYTELKMYGEHDLKWTSFNDKNEFRKEHLDWTDKLQHYKNGIYTRTYPEYMYEVISKPIDTYFPVLLNSTSNYNEESNFQSNCVKGYIGKASSIIISLRTGEFLTERATLEYVLTKKSGKINVDRVQSLGKFNKKLDEQWNTVLLKLDQVVLSCVRDKRFEPVKLTKECKNGVILNSDSYWNEEGYLKWNVINIERNSSLMFDLTPQF